MQRPAYLLIALLCLFPFLLRAQQMPVTLKLDSVKIGELVSAIEKQAPVHFYYDEHDVDSIRISFSCNNEPLASALQKAFATTDIYFAADEQKQIFLTRGVAIPLPPVAGVTDAPALPGRRSTIVRADPTDDDPKTGKKATRALLENKVYEIGDAGAGNTSKTAILAGYVRDAKTGEPIAGASIYLEAPRIGVSTDQYGYYTITIPKGRHIINIQSIGMRDTRRQLLIRGDGRMNIDLYGQVTTLKNVIVSAQKLSNVRSTQMGVQKIDIKTIKQVPVVFGEADVLRVVLTLPGVKSVGEASTGLNVRGGAADQNLILFNDATIFNPSHFFGLFSAFNPEVVKDVQLYKSSIPARYGGRLSSVLDISSREGNKKNITGTAGIGLLTSRLDIEGPLVKDKTSFILGGRTTYANWLLNLLPEEYKNSRASFYDLNLNISHQANKKNNIYFTGYLSKDRFNLNSDTTYGYGNANFSLKWKHVFSNALYSVFTGGWDHYQYENSSEHNPVNAYKLSFNLNQSYFKALFIQNVGSDHVLEYGLQSIYYRLNPGKYIPLGGKSLVAPDTIPHEQALESAAFLSDRYTISSAFSVEGGIRYSLYNYLGAQTVNEYSSGLPKTPDNQTGTATYGSGHFIKSYGGPEFRLSARYAFNDSFSIKAGYNTQRQYIHVLSNTAAMAPTDIWKLSDPNISPQYGDQVSLGLYKNLKSNTIEASVEVYYKRIRDYLDYKSGAVLVMNHHVETEVFKTRGKAYGVEVLIKKLTGKFNGWISYTYSRTLLKQDDPLAGENINGGAYYPANFDKPHDVTFIGNYRINHRFSLSFNATYSTGRPITLPIGVFYYGGSYRTLFAGRNAYRIPDYFRSDFAMNIDGNHKVHQKTHNSWTIGVYNLTGRKNAYSVYYVSENGVVNGYKLSVFGSAIPYINFNIRF